MSVCRSLSYGQAGLRLQLLASAKLPETGESVKVFIVYEISPESVRDAPKYCNSVMQFVPSSMQIASTPIIYLDVLIFEHVVHLSAWTRKRNNTSGRDDDTQLDCFHQVQLNWDYHNRLQDEEDERFEPPPSMSPIFRLNIASMVSALPLTDLKRVAIHDVASPIIWGAPVDYAWWRRLFEECSTPGLTDVSVTGLATHALVPLLTSQNSEVPGDANFVMQRPLFPTLSRLTLHLGVHALAIQYEYLIGDACYLEPVLLSVQYLQMVRLRLLNRPVLGDLDVEVPCTAEDLDSEELRACEREL